MKTKNQVVLTRRSAFTYQSAKAKERGKCSTTVTGHPTITFLCIQ